MRCLGKPSRNLTGVILTLACMFVLTFGLICKSLASDNRIPANSKALHNYLEKKGYRIIKDEGPPERRYGITLTKKFLVSQYGIMVWGVQSVDPTPYIGREFFFWRFLVKNHPLDKWSTQGVTAVSLIIIDGKVVGGLSMPYETEILVGSHPHDLDGRDLDAKGVVSRDDYDAWVAKWRKRFR